MNEKIIKALLKDFEPGHTEYQIRNFIVGSEVHPWHQYMQCLREIDGRVRILRRPDRERKSRFKFWRRKRNGRLPANRSVRRELAHFINIAVELRERHNFGSLSGEQKKILESESWREKAKFMLCMDIFCMGRPSKPTVEFIYKLPKKEKRELLMEVDPRNKQKVIEYLVG